MISLYDELFLLALDEEKGNFLPLAKKTISFGLSGAILAELALRNKFAINDKQRLEMQDAAPIGEEILDEILQEIAAAEKPRKLTYWVSYFGEHPKRLRVKIGECLAARNLVQQDENRFHWNASGAAQSEPAVHSKYQMKNQLREVILADAELDPRRLALLNILSAAGLLNLVFTADELSSAQQLIHEKVMHQALKDRSLQTIEEIEYAITASIEDSND